MFDRARVKGVVANLLKGPDARFATALEIAAGTKLYQMVVDTKTLESCCLRRESCNDE